MPLPRRLTACAVTVGVVGGLGAAFLAGSSMTGTDERSAPDGAGPTGSLPDAAAVAYRGSDLTLAGSCAELLDWYVERGLAAVGPYGWGPGGDVLYATGGDVLNTPTVRGRLSAVQEDSGSVASPRTTRVTNGETGTNVQEQGVDEPDVVKTDGSTLFRVQRGDLTTYDLRGDEVERLASTDLPGLGHGELLLSGDTVVAIGDDELRPQGNRPYGPYGDDGAATRVIVLDVSDPAAPAVTHTYTYDSTQVAARLHGDTVRMVLRSGPPDLDFATPRGRRTAPATRANQDAVRESTIDDWLPSITVDGGAPERLLDCDQVARPQEDAGLGTMTVVGFRADVPEDRSVTGLAVSTDLAYASADQLYLATSPYSGPGFPCCIDVFPPRRIGGPFAEDGASRLYEFDLDGTATTYTASGEVDGSIDDRWAMDEYDGVLRVAVGATQRTGNFNSVVTLRQDGNDLVEVGRIDGLGRNEQIRSMRWFDGLAIMVTFRQVDPLYAIDLSDVTDPTLIGSLKIPGFSEYLHPLGEHRLIGVGQGPSENGRRWGAQVGLFDVGDLTDVRRLDVESYAPGTTARAGTDPRQFTWLPDQRTVLTVVAGSRGTGWVSALSLADGAMTNTMVRVEYGSEVDDVRLVPLPDHRVVLVTGDGADFFDLPA